MKNDIFICHNCPMTRTMATIGTKWKPIIIYAIGIKTLRFGEVFARVEIISKKVLTQQLKELVEDEIVIRTAYQEVPLRVEYQLTEKGIELLKILNQLTLWNQKYNMEGYKQEE
ncbi:MULTISPECIES: helix-turn-helix domain-containing protein [Myroides]|uniref:winged helix-turn-helix transcriptional regulator n=1 Tax=Myroides odoratus TaxID=256 RepID=UPI0024C012A9|nr:helix-turn-helix domain-containing protein [Myroides sp. mNGS23_01]WHT39600.1 helix-turn-helix domain-containing protein [Myroides sp. mNGS23_01]